MSSYLKDCLASPLDKPFVDDFVAVCRAIGISPVDNPTKADYINAMACWRSAQDCAKCNVARAGCSRNVVNIVEGRVKCTKTACFEFEAREYIRRADVPFKFARIRASDVDLSRVNDRVVGALYDCFSSNSGLYLFGAPGTGKTFLSSVIVNERAYKLKPSVFCTVTDMLEDLRDFDNNLRRIEKLNKLKKCSCLVIDDLGAEHQSDWVAATLFDILDSRYKADLQTVINSNFSLDELVSRISGYHAERIARRIVALCGKPVCL